MKITITKEWFRSRAHLEEGHEIGAGSLQHIGKPALNVLPANTTAADISFGQTVSLLRRKRRWTIGRLAEKAEAMADELIAIETKPDCVPELSTVVSLAKTFRLPAKAFIHKAGLTDAASSRLHETPLRYAACSEFKEPLTPDEEHVLESVLKAIVEHPSPE
jgi:DNA-binding XRE family transcriptional regulator